MQGTVTTAVLRLVSAWFEPALRLDDLGKAEHSKLSAVFQVSLAERACVKGIKGRGLAFRLAVLVLASTTMIFAAAFYYGYLASREAMFEAVQESARHLTLATINEIELALRGLERISLEIAYLLERYAFPQEDLRHLLLSTVSSNLEIFGSAIAFQPYAFDPAARYFAPYCYRTSEGGTNVVFLGSEQYDYFSMEWYQAPRDRGRPVWSEPYFDEGGGNILMTTFSVPFYREEDGQKTFQGVVTADLSLARLRKIVSSIKIYETGFAFVVSQKGMLVTHPNEQWVMRENMTRLAEVRGDKHALQVVNYMVRGGEGFVPFTSFSSGRKCWMYYAPVPSTGWSLAVIFPEDELFADLHELARNVVLIGLAGFILLVVVIIFIARSITRPVRELAVTTEAIAQGNLDIELPQPISKDEIAALTHAFGEMRVALKTYIANLAETTAARERIESELKIARAIQMSFLPRRFPAFPREEAFEIFAALEPAREIGGDFYDFFPLGDHRLLFSIGDVSGKGIPAALFMAVTKTLIKGIVSSNGLDLAEVFRRVNFELCQDNEAMMFTTAFCGILDFTSRELHYTNAGHLPPLLIRSGKVGEWLKIPPGTALGVDEEARYQTAVTALQPGDVIILYTDGVTEAMNAAEQMYSAERLLAAVDAHLCRSSEEWVGAVFDSVRTHASGAPQSDDITVMTVVLRK